MYFIKHHLYSVYKSIIEFIHFLSILSIKMPLELVKRDYLKKHYSNFNPSSSHLYLINLFF